MRLPALLLLFFSSLLFSTIAAEKPNVLFLAIDDQNNWIGCMGGHPQVKTPHIDGLAARGTLFTNAQCQSPLCNPSRTSVMTGKRPSTTGVYGLAPWFRDVPELADTVTLPQAFEKHGYSTHMGGKIFHGRGGRKPTDKEFQHIGPSAGVGVRPKKKLVDTPAKHPLVDWGVFDHRDEDKGDWKVATWAVDSLDELGNADDDKPFFLACGFFLPHVPCYATQKWFDLYPEETLTLPPFLENDRADTPRFSWYIHWKLPEPRHEFLIEAGEWKNAVRSYLACTSFVDSQVGRVLGALDRHGFAENTIIVLWTDHGYHLGEKEITGKNTLWDNSANVPLMFAGPGITPRQVCTKPAELLDMYPTLLELAGLPANPELEGHSLVPQCKDADAAREFPAITTHNHDNHGVRSENWRYIVYADGSEELYDMREDPNEWHNLAKKADHKSVIAKLRSYLPKVNAKPAPGSRSRVLTLEEGVVTWEGSVIAPDAPIPELSK